MELVEQVLVQLERAIQELETQWLATCQAEAETQRVRGMYRRTRQQLRNARKNLTRSLSSEPASLPALAKIHALEAELALTRHHLEDALEVLRDRTQNSSRPVSVVSTVDSLSFSEIADAWKSRAEEAEFIANELRKQLDQERATRIATQEQLQSSVQERAQQSWGHYLTERAEAMNTPNNNEKEHEHSIEEMRTQMEANRKALLESLARHEIEEIGAPPATKQIDAE